MLEFKEGRHAKWDLDHEIELLREHEEELAEEGQPGAEQSQESE